MTSITIESTNTSNVTKQKSIPYINENASDSELLAFAQAVNNLTKNTYVKTDRIDKRNLDTDPKQTRNINLRYCHGTTGTAYTYDGSLARIPYSSLTHRTNPTAKVFNVIIDTQTTTPTVLPVVTAENVQGPSVLGGQLNTTYFNPQTSNLIFTNLIFVQPDVYGTFTLHYQIVAGDGFDAFETTMNIEIYDDSQEG